MSCSQTYQVAGPGLSTGCDPHPTPTPRAKFGENPNIIIFVVTSFKASCWHLANESQRDSALVSPVPASNFPKTKVIQVSAVPGLGVLT